MARTKKTKEMELNTPIPGEVAEQEIPTVEDIEAVYREDDSPMLLDDPLTGELLARGEKMCAQVDTDSQERPEMEAGDEGLSETDTVPDGHEPLFEADIVPGSSELYGADTAPEGDGLAEADTVSGDGEPLSEANTVPDGSEPLPEEMTGIANPPDLEDTLSTGEQIDSYAAQDSSVEEAVPVKPKRPARKKKTEDAPASGEITKIPASLLETGVSEPEKTKPTKGAAKKRTPTPSVLTIESRAEVETPDEREEVIWHEIHNAYRTRKILTGTLGGIEQTENGKTLAIVYYKEMRVVIPMKEMMINPSQENAAAYGDMMQRQNKILGTMLGAHIDFIVKGIEAKTRSIVASRRDAMLKKRQLFYMDTDINGMYRIYEDRIVQARVIGVADKVIRVEIFGVECSIMARDLSWDWMGDAHERFSVGDEILVRILSVKREMLEEISVKADVKSVSGTNGRENLSKCKVQGKYAGKVTDIHKGTVFVRLAIGVNAIAHSCYDNRMPGKKDDVSFAVTHLDEEHGVAVGIITRIIKQNL